MYRVMIVEDDPMVAAINREYVEKNEKLRVTACFKNGVDALAHLRDNPVDLIILDMYMPVMDGREFLKHLRHKRHSCDVIMVTAADDADNVTRLIELGVVDYLIKPFEYQRFKESLTNYVAHKDRLKEMKKGDLGVTQDSLDELYLKNKRKARADDCLEKGLQPKTLARIQDYIDSHREGEMTCEEIAAAVDLSKVTVRRYLNYLLEQGSIASDIDYTTGGRPSFVYRVVQ